MFCNWLLLNEKKHLNPASKVSVTLWNLLTDRAVLEPKQEWSDRVTTQKCCDRIIRGVFHGVKFWRHNLSQTLFIPSIYRQTLISWHPTAFLLLIGSHNVLQSSRPVLIFNSAEIDCVCFVSFLCGSKRRPKMPICFSCRSSLCTSKMHRCMYWMCEVLTLAWAYYKQ